MKRKLTKKDIAIVEQVRSSLQRSLNKLSMLSDEGVVSDTSVINMPVRKVAFRMPENKNLRTKLTVHRGRKAKEERLSVDSYRRIVAQIFEEHPNGLAFKEVERLVENQISHKFVADDVRVIQRTGRQRWLYQLSSLKGRLMKQGWLKQIGTDNDNQPIYSMSKRGIKSLMTA